jgi:nucleotidyltransferase/DNA polymerase involved in DNA repair
MILSQRRTVLILFFVSPRFDRYKEISNKIQSILRSIRIWSSLSLDEAYLDVTQNKKGNPVPAFWQKKLIAYF